MKAICVSSKDDIAKQLSKIIEIVRRYREGAAREEILERGEPLEIQDRAARAP